MKRFVKLLRRYSPFATFMGLGLSVLSIILANWNWIMNFFGGSWLLSGGWILSLVIGFFFLIVWIQDRKQERERLANQRTQTLLDLAEIVAKNQEFTIKLAKMSISTNEKSDVVAQALMEHQKQFGRFVESVSNAFKASQIT